MKAQLALLSLLVFCSVTNAAIYGADNRKDIGEVLSLAPQATAVAITLPINYLKDVSKDFYQVDDVQTFGKLSVMCSDERFVQQPAFQIGTCTGFLFGDKYLITAGHCILPNGIVNDQLHPFCEAFSWYFGFNTAAQAQTTNQLVRKDQVYNCKRVIRAENVVGGNDFAVLELDRRVTLKNSNKLMTPLTLRTTDVAVNEKVFAIGHPFGLPAKFSGLSPVLSIASPDYFEVNLDTAGGNSGGPVLDQKKQVVGILIEGHPVDAIADRNRSCNRVNRCNESGTKCLGDSPFPELSTANRVQRLTPALKYLPNF